MENGRTYAKGWYRKPGRKRWLCAGFADVRDHEDVRELLLRVKSEGFVVRDYFVVVRPYANGGHYRDEYSLKTRYVTRGRV